MAPHSSTLAWKIPQTEEPGRLQSMKSLSRVRLLATPWTAAYQAPLPMGFSRQEYRSGVPLPSPISMFNKVLKYKWTSLVAQMVKNPPAVQETWA